MLLDMAQLRASRSGSSGGQVEGGGVAMQQQQEELAAQKQELGQPVVGPRPITSTHQLP